MAKGSARPLMMTMRLGFVLALLLGLVGLTGIAHFSGALQIAHVVAGLLFAVPLWLLMFRPGSRGGVMAAGLLALLGAALGIAAAWFGLQSSPYIHLAIMVIAVGLVESSVARSTRASRQA